MSKLALKGGKPVRKKSFTAWPIFGRQEEKALSRVLRSGKWGIGGEANDEFASEFAKYHEARFGITCANGTVGLTLALRATGIGYGDEVIVPAYTFIATASSVLSLGAVPVFVDIDPKTYNIDPDMIVGAISPRTKAIIPVHIAGNPAHLDRIIALARERQLIVIEDAAQAHGAEWRGHKIGAIGHMGAFSFQSSKNVSAGEGGIVLTNDEGLADKVWSYMNVGRSRKEQSYDPAVLGWNFRMTEFQAALLNVQLKRVEQHMRRRERNAAHLAMKLHEIGGIEHIGAYPEATRHSYHLFVMKYDRSQFSDLPRDRFIDAMRAEGIPISPGYATGPLYRLRAIVEYQIPGIRLDYSKTFLPIAERACREEGMWLTQNILLGKREDMEDIVEAITKIKENASELL